MAALAAGRNVSLTERQSKFLDEQVASGRHASASEVVREALRRYEADVEHEAATLEAMQASAALGMADFEAGRFTTYSTSEERHAGTAKLLAEAIGASKARAGAD
jgi:antitoxin ParD1/3/4